MNHMDHNLEEQIREFLKLRDTFKDIEPRLKMIESDLKQHMSENGIKKVTVDGRTVTLVPVAGARSFNADELKKLVSASVFNQVTEHKVKTDLFDAAVSLGKIAPDIADKVTSKTPYNQLRVN